MKRDKFVHEGFHIYKLYVQCSGTKFSLMKGLNMLFYSINIFIYFLMKQFENHNRIDLSTVT